MLAENGTSLSSDLQTTSSSEDFSLNKTQIEILGVFSFISLLATLAIIIIYLRSSVKKNLTFKLILMLNICDFGFSLFRFINSSSYNNTDEYNITMNMIIHFFALSSIMWVLSISVIAYMSIFSPEQVNNSLFGFFFQAVTGFVAFNMILIYAFTDISKPQIHFTMTLPFYILSLLVFLTSTTLYTLIVLQIRKETEDKYKQFIKTIFYPAVIPLLWIPAFLNFLNVAAFSTNQVGIIINYSCASLIGTFNAFIYGYSEKLVKGMLVGRQNSNKNQANMLNQSLLMKSSFIDSSELASAESFASRSNQINDSVFLQNEGTDSPDYPKQKLNAQNSNQQLLTRSDIMFIADC